MKKLYIFLLVLVPIIQSCDKESEDHSFTTYYPTLELKGDESVSVIYGEDYNDPGCFAEVNGNDVSSDVEITTDFQKNEYGIFTVNYKITNADGYLATSSREIVVINPNDKVSQGYITITNTRDDIDVEYTTSILFNYQGPNTYYISDLLGGFYSQGRGYGNDYALPGTIKIEDDGTVSLLNSGTCAFGGAASNVSGTYDLENKTFSIKTTYLGYNFNMIVE